MAAAAAVSAVSVPPGQWHGRVLMMAAGRALQQTLLQPHTQPWQRCSCRRAMRLELHGWQRVLMLGLC